jgi:voltage-gated potassium channel
MPRLARSQDAYDRFSAATDLPLTILALLWLPILVVPLVVHLPAVITDTLDVIDYVVWALFAVEYLIRLYLAPARRHFVAHHLVDLAVVALPVLRLLRALRLLRLVNLARVGVVLANAAHRTRRILTHRGLSCVLLAVLVIVIICSGMELAFEQHAPGSTIHNFGDALWWATVTVTTVGYGDKTPTSAGGRGVAVALMLVGIGLIGALTATVASYLVEEKADRQTAELNARLECFVFLPETLFDLHAPGHYMRRINSVSLSIPLSPARSRASPRGCGCFRGRTVRADSRPLGGHRYRRVDNDARFCDYLRAQARPSSPQAVSRTAACSKPTSVMSATCRSSIAGAFSQWHVKLLPPYPQVDPEGITDPLMNNALHGPRRRRRFGGPGRERHPHRSQRDAGQRRQARPVLAAQRQAGATRRARALPENLFTGPGRLSRPPVTDPAGAELSSLVWPAAHRRGNVAATTNVAGTAIRQHPVGSLRTARDGRARVISATHIRRL